MELRPYQLELLERAREALREVRSVVVQLATGGGKTALSSKMLHSAAQRGREGMFIVHRAELVEQTARTFDEFGIPYGVISAGWPANPYQPIQIASVDTLRHRLAGAAVVRVPALCVWDECHHIAASGWQRVKSYFHRARHVGLTATPERLDGRGLDEEFERLVCGPSPAWLIEHGYLCRYRAFAPGSPDLSGVHVRNGDYVRGEAEGVMNQSAITGDAVTHYLRHARDGQGLAFCTSVRHSLNVMQAFRDAGIPAAHLDGDTERAERRRVIAAFRKREIRVLCNVDLFGEGFDVPSADVAILLRPTKSLALFLQQCGRVLRAAPGKEWAVLLDHAGNLRRHGLPDDERAWTLEGEQARKKRKASERDSEPVLRPCPRCLTLQRPGPRCAACGAVNETGREVAEIEGDLAEVDLKAVRVRRQAEERQARTLEELIALGRARGYRSPEGWARHYWSAREQRRERMGAEGA